MSNLNRRVKLNVGGQIFETTVGTLTRVNGSLLAKLVENADENNDEQIFIDHDPRYFSSVLNFLRDGRIPLPDDIKEIDELRREAQYFNLKSMTDFIDCEEQRGPPFFRGDKVVWKDHNFHRALSKCGWQFDGTTEESRKPLCFIPRTSNEVKTCGLCGTTSDSFENNYRTIFELPRNATFAVGDVKKQACWKNISSKQMYMQAECIDVWRLQVEIFENTLNLEMDVKALVLERPLISNWHQVYRDSCCVDVTFAMFNYLYHIPAKMLQLVGTSYTSAEE